MNGLEMKVVVVVETQYFQHQSIESGVGADTLKMNEVADDGWKIVKNKKRKATRMNAIG